MACRARSAAPRHARRADEHAGAPASSRHRPGLVQGFGVRQRRQPTAIATGLRRVWPDADLRLVPLADGGEGTLDAVLSAGGQRRTARVSGAAGAPSRPPTA